MRRVNEEEEEEEEENDDRHTPSIFPCISYLNIALLD